MKGLLETSPGEALTNDQRAAFERDGYVVLPGVLSADEVGHYTSLVDGLYEREFLAGRLPSRGALHRLSAVNACPELSPLIDHPRLLGPVWSILGWNIHIYHSHIDVHPTVRGPKPPRFEWHQDGGRQNRELETDPRPRLSVKGVYWLSDVSQPGRGNFKVVPGSHGTNWIDGPPQRNMAWPDPAGAIEVVANPGDVVLFDRRIWHARSDNFSDITRKAVFFAYTYRWVVGRDLAPADETRYTPVQRQLLGLLGNIEGHHAWGYEAARVPLYAMLAEAGLLDPAVPVLRP